MFEIQFNPTSLNQQIQLQLTQLEAQLNKKLLKIPLIHILTPITLTNHLLFTNLDLQPLPTTQLAAYQVHFKDNGFINVKTHFQLKMNGFEPSDFNLNLFLEEFVFEGEIQISQNLEMKMSIKTLQYKGIGGGMLEKVIGQFQFEVQL